MIKCAVIESENVHGEKIIQYYDEYDFKKWPKTLKDPSLTPGYFLTDKEMKFLFNRMFLVEGRGMTFEEYLKEQGVKSW